MTMFKIGALAFLSALICSYLGVAGVRRWAERRQVLDVPKEHSSHTRPAPTTGGLPIVVVTIVGAWCLLWVTGAPLPIPKLVFYTVGAVLLALVSFYDDVRRPLPTGFRFAAHTLAAVLAIWMLGPWEALKTPILEQVHLGWLGLPVTFLWVVGLSNAYNFMDGIDGIAGAQAVVVGLGWGLLASMSGQPFVGLLGLVLAGSSLGFLIHNWPPARIFMGDVGSIFLGYNCAVLPLMMISVLKPSGARDWVPLAGVLLLWPFVFDTVYTILRRLAKGEDVSQPHRSHFYQRLVIAGLSHCAVTLIYTGFALTGLIWAVVYVAWPANTAWLIVLGLLVETTALTHLVRRYERRKGGPIAAPDQVLGKASGFGLPQPGRGGEGGRMKKGLFKSHILMVIGVDGALVVLCYYMAFLLRFEFSIPPDFMTSFKESWPFVLGTKLAVFALFHLYRGMWRYTRVEDLFNVFKAVFTGSLLVMFVVLMLYRFEGYPRSVLLTDGFLTLVAIAGFRVLVRLYFACGTGFELFPSVTSATKGWKKVLIIGAGDAAEKVIREIRENPDLKVDPVGLLDEDPDTHGKTIHGIPVLGAVERVKRLGVPFDEILIAAHPVGREQMRRIVEMCEETDKRYLILPRMGEIINGSVSLKSVRKVNLADLLGREEVRLDQEAVGRFLRGARVLVTGAGGSIGSELVRRVCHFGPQALALLDFSENNLFAIERECLEHFPYVPRHTYLADIRNRDALTRIFREFHPQVVFHAAAFKHVPMQELHPREAVLNNVLGTRHLVDVGLGEDLKCFVLVSTDKAVRPVSVMGATKRVAEMIVECMNSKKGGRFLSVRFGNVLASSGSVVNIFEEQIARGGPVTVTHPETTRYFMSLSEAAMLILQSAAMGEGGETFVLDMGKPLKVLDMAKDLIRLHGFEPERDISIKFIGLRPGEKLLEDLITEGEGIAPTSHEKIMLYRGDRCDSCLLETQIDELLEVAETYDAGSIKGKLQEIVKDYRPSP
jgi:FlaA1/EpsC-like NDP-sugar epimerase/UDP-N-acetylmuramyl pentapeptide phosphotransferase/UDP-N-acetylglucosamine-1-phosphate transferase